MAGDWIKMRTDLASSPKVVRMASALRADRLRVVGGLHAAWALFDAHSTDGWLEGYTVEIMDELIGWPGFAQAMIDVRWLSNADPARLCMPEFDTHNGQPAKRRAQEADRKRKERRKASASDADEMRTREEQSREDPLTDTSSTTLARDNEHDAGFMGGSQAGALAVALNRAGFRCTSMNPDLIAAAEEGVTVDHLLELAAMERCRGKPAGYLISIARREVTQGPSNIGSEVQHATRWEGRQKLSAADQVARSIAQRFEAD